MRPAHVSILAVLGAAVLGGCERDATAEGDPPLPTGLVLTGGRVWTGSDAAADSALSPSAVAVAGDRIVAVATDEEVSALVPAGARRITAGTPVFVQRLDGHMGLDGLHPGGWVPAQKVSVAEALAAYTEDGAYTRFAEADLGRIENGLLADLVVLSADPFSVDPADLAGVAVDLTVVGGEVRYSR